MNSPRDLVNKLWAFCHVLRDDGVSTLDYVQQLTLLLFLKMSDEQTGAPWHRPSPVPAGLGWQSLLSRSGEDLENHYTHLLRELGARDGMLGQIFRKSQNKIQDPARLTYLIHTLIDQENWSQLDVDVKGDAYEGLLDRGVADGGAGAGQYFTPRALIQAIVDVMQPEPEETIVDPACGTGGFLLAAQEYVVTHHQLDPDQRKHVRDELVTGFELVDDTARLAAMNMLLHGIGTPNGASPIRTGDSLKADPGGRWSMVLANPPFGVKSSNLVINDEGEAVRERVTTSRDDFWVETSNKQLNFVQHIHTILDTHGRAAVVLPDNVLFEGGAGEKIRRKLLETCDVHTILRLPTGIFYAGGVKANVVFFDKKPASKAAWTRETWVYDFRTGERFTMKTRPMTREHLQPFVDAYKADARHQRVESDRFRKFSYDELVGRDKVNLDISWLADDSLDDPSKLPDPQTLIADIAAELQDLLGQVSELAAIVESAKAGPGE
ncbi:N-6 DNA methylase [Cellulomonas sp. CW35]|uniref:N-6 DNA methylase n=1 Tax=Cellulomonas sp. CW35 TaxID=3458249 RepID=UPI004033C3ED